MSWDGGGDNVSVDDPLNWDTDTNPTSTDDVVINAPGVTLGSIDYWNEWGFSGLLYSTLELQAGTVGTGADYYALKTAIYGGGTNVQSITLSGGTFDLGHLQVGRGFDATFTQNAGLVMLDPASGTAGELWLSPSSTIRGAKGGF